MLQSSELSYGIVLSRDAAPLGSTLLWSLQLSFLRRLSESSSPHHQFLRSFRCLSDCSLPVERRWGKVFKRDTGLRCCTHKGRASKASACCFTERRGGAGQFLWESLKQLHRWKSHSGLGEPQDWELHTDTRRTLGGWKPLAQVRRRLMRCCRTLG